MRINKYTTHKGDENLPILVREFSKNYPQESSLTSPEKIATMMRTIFQMDKQTEEIMYMICFDIKQHVQGIFEISRGTVNSSLCSPREIFMKALLCGAVNVALVHNHPSGVSNPSNADIKITKRIKECGKLLNVILLDHIVIADDYFSFKENNIL